MNEFSLPAEIEKQVSICLVAFAMYFNGMLDKIKGAKAIKAQIASETVSGLSIQNMLIPLRFMQ